MPAFLSELTDEQLLIAGLDPLTKRDLIASPPAAGETMQKVGISKTRLDGPVRSWLNARFRRPRKLPALTRGAIKVSTKWSQLLDLVKAKKS